jgi:hypothetical protein
VTLKKKKEAGKVCCYEFKESGYKCNRDALPGDERCIFHSKDIKGKKDKFYNAFWEEYDIKKKEGKGYNFNGFVFPEGFSFKRENLSGVNFRNSDLTVASLRKADLTTVILIGAKLTGANLTGAILIGVILTKANLTGAILRGVNLTGAILRGAVFKTANFEKCNITDIEYDRKGIYKGIRLSDCYGDPLFIRFAKDQEYLEAFKKKHPHWYRLWYIFADCGRSFFRWALWSILFAVMFAFIYHNIFYLKDGDSFNRANIHDTWSGFSLIYYSVVTFTTLGFGDITPKPGWLQFWVMLEVILGYIILGGLISILANKFARRS